MTNYSYIQSDQNNGAGIDVTCKIHFTVILIISYFQVSLQLNVTVGPAQ